MYNHASMIPDECRHSNAPPLHAAAHAPLAARDHLPAASHLTRDDRPLPDHCLQLSGAREPLASPGEGRITRSDTPRESKAAGKVARAAANTSRRQPRRLHVDGENPVGARGKMVA